MRTPAANVQGFAAGVWSDLRTRLSRQGPYRPLNTGFHGSPRLGDRLGRATESSGDEYPLTCPGPPRPRRSGPRSAWLGAKELRTALLLADITVETLLDRQEVLVQRGDTDRLVLDAGNRAQLFQAQGMVMVRLGVSLAEAMIRMRAYAFAENRRLDDVAWDIVNHKLRLGPSHT